MNGKRKFESADPLRRGGQRRIPPGALARAAASGRGAAAGGGASPGVNGPGNAPMANMAGMAMGPMGMGRPGQPGQPGHPGLQAGPSGAGGLQAGAGLQAGPSGPNSPAPAAPQQYSEFSLRACTPEDMEDSRYHMIKFHSRTKVDPATQFTPPIRFHRKDPKNLQMVVGTDDGEGGADDEDKPKRGGNFRRRKTHQTQGGDAASEAARKLRYEEHYPWVMEDFDSKNTWVSSYEAAQSDAYVVFVFDKNGFKMIPVEKWYKLTARNKFASLSLEEAEERMGKRNANIPRWIMDKLQTERSTPGAAGAAAGAASGAGIGGAAGAGSGVGAGFGQRRMRTVEGSEERGRRQAMDEEMDFDEEFADDEEAPLMDGPEEDLKEVEERLKREQRQANAIHEEAGEDLDDLFEDDDGHIDKNGKKLRKYLRSLEKNAYYDSDDDENPYASEDDSDSDPEVKADPDGPAGSASVNGGGRAPDPALLMLPFRKKTIKNRPHGMAVLQLPPRVLGTFPLGLWNPAVNPHPRPESAASAAPAEPQVKPEPMSPGAPGTSLATATETDPNLLTADDVRQAISTNSLTIKGLIGILRPKLRLHATNPDRLRKLLREIASLRDDKLVLNK